MAYKEILAYAEARAASQSCLDVAARLSAAHGAHLVALHVIEPPVLPGDGGFGMSAELIEWQQQYAQKRAEEAKRYVAGAEQRSGQTIEWRAPDGELVSTALLHSRYADLVVVSQADDEAQADLPEIFVMGSGRPTLVVPHDGKFTKPIEHVLVAWNRTREATRALHDALPILIAAKAVTVMEVKSENGHARHIAGADIGQHLARHGVKVNVSSTVAGDIDVGNVILSRAADFGADCIVMGAYGHSRMREFVFGGATRQILASMTVPVFMVH